MEILKFAFAVFLAFLPGFLGMMVVPLSEGENFWYSNLISSELTPAAWVFSVAWTVLYFLIGIALYLVMRNKNNVAKVKKTTAYMWFVFAECALAVLFGLIVSAIFMARAFMRVNNSAGWLIVPYILWLMFAFYLNAMIVFLN